jgi:hypothetical protein
VAPAGHARTSDRPAQPRAPADHANEKELQEKLLQTGAIAGRHPAAAMQKRLAADRARWTKVAMEKNICAT